MSWKQARSECPNIKLVHCIYAVYAECGENTHKILECKYHMLKMKYFKVSKRESQTFSYGATCENVCSSH